MSFRQRDFYFLGILDLKNRKDLSILKIYEQWKFS